MRLCTYVSVMIKDKLWLYALLAFLKTIWGPVSIHEAIQVARFALHGT